MLKGKRMMCLLGLSLLVNTYNIDTSTPFHGIAEQSIENKIDFNEVVHKNNLGLIEHPIFVRFEKDKEELEKKKQEEQIKLEQYKEPEWQEKNFIVSYYGATYNECGNNKFITASGIPVKEGHVAVPKDIPFGSKLIINGIEYTATDRGNPNYIKTLGDGSIKVDVFIPRLSYETDYQYEKRINKLGIKKVVGKLLIRRSDRY